MKLKLLDTNIVLDIIYNKRENHNIALEFYKKFNNYELSIENIVAVECFNVINKKVSDFTSDFRNFIISRDKLKKNWDSLEPIRRSEVLNDFLKDDSRKKFKGNLPFFISIIEEIRDEIIYYNLDNVLKYLLELPGELEEFFKQTLDNKLTIIYPNTEVLNIADHEINTNFKKMINFQAIIKNSNIFKSNQQRDLEILVNLVNIKNYGTIDSQVSFIYFYLNDSTFENNFKAIKNKMPELTAHDVNKNYIGWMNNIEFRNPYNKGI